MEVGEEEWKAGLERGRARRWLHVPDGLATHSPRRAHGCDSRGRDRSCSHRADHAGRIHLIVAIQSRSFAEAVISAS